MTWFTFAAAVGPALYLVWYFVSRDVFREPTHMILKTFALGIVIVFPVLLIAWPVADLISGIDDPYLYGTAQAFLTAAIPEEAMKLCVVWVFAARSIHFDEPMDGIVYGAVASLGFAAFENVLYVAQGGISIAILRAFTAVPAHAAFGAMMGWYVSRAVFVAPGHPKGSWWPAFLVPMLFHGIYDAPLLAMGAHPDGPDWLVLVGWVTIAGVLFVQWRFIRHAIRELRAKQFRRA